MACQIPPDEYSASGTLTIIDGNEFSVVNAEGDVLLTGPPPGRHHDFPPGHLDRRHGP